MKIITELKSRQLPFHHTETKYYKLIKNMGNKDKIKTYKKLRKSKKFFRLIYFIKKTLKDNYSKKKYNQLYHRIITMADFKNPFDTLPENDINCLYIQKVGSEWCIFNKYK